MLTSGDLVDLDLGMPEGREAGFGHPAIVITAQRVLDNDPSVVHIVPLTSTLRGFGSEVVVEADVMNGLAVESAAQCQHIRAAAVGRILGIRGNVGPVILSQIRGGVGVLLDIAN